MKKYLFGILSIFFCLVIVAKAQTYNFTSNLAVGASGGDVTALQNYLISQGYDIAAITSGRAQKGYFGSQTRMALIKYQIANGIPGTGFFGPLTRARFGGGNNQGASLTVTFPNGNETWQKNTTQVISWTGAQGILNQNGTIKLQIAPPPCADPANGPIRCMILVRAPYNIATVNLASQTYTWNVGNNMGGETIPDGKYKIQICSNDSSVCDESDNYFYISSNSNGGQAPVINSIDAPTTLTTNQNGTWHVYASDPSGGSLYYSVDWGDVSYGAACPLGYSCVPMTMMSAVQQGSSFTHSYAYAGTYTVRFTIRNSVGLTAQSSATVVVTGGTTNGSITVISPNNGEVWIANSTQPLRWTYSGLDSNSKVDLYLDQTNIYCITTPCGQTFLLDKNIPINSTYNWIVATDINNIKIMPADYKFRVCLAGSTTVCDSTDKFFTIKPQTYY